MTSIHVAGSACLKKDIPFPCILLLSKRYSFIQMTTS